MYIYIYIYRPTSYTTRALSHHSKCTYIRIYKYR